MNKAVFDFNLRSVEEAKRHREELIADVAHQLKSKVYNRTDYLSQAIVILYGFESEEPNTVNPTVKDVSDTVHIISRLEAELKTEEMKIKTGLFPANYSKRIKLVHAIGMESEILNKQLTIMRQAEEINKNVQAIDQQKKAVNQ